MPLGLEEGLQRADLVDDHRVGFARRDIHLPAAEADEVGQAGMGADGNAVLRAASATVFRITIGSPPWKPQATLAVVISGMIASSAPIGQLPKLSPQSQLMSMVRGLVMRGRAPPWRRLRRFQMSLMIGDAPRQPRSCGR